MASPANVPKKALTPKKMGLNIAPVSADEIIKTSKSALKSLVKSKVITPRVQEFCSDILDSSDSGETTFNPGFTAIDPKDLGVIISDFGEVAGAVYVLRKYRSDYSHAKFPTDENEKLIDYYLVDRKTKDDHPFSAKAGQGGAPAITSVKKELEMLNERNMITGKLVKALKVLELLSIEKQAGESESANFRGVILASQYLDSHAWKELIKILKIPELKSGYTSGLPKLEHLEAAVAAAGKYPGCMKYFRPLLDAAQMKEKPDSTEVAINSPGSSKSPWGILHFPLTSDLIRWLNNDDNGARQLLVMAARMKNINQVYLDVSGSKSKPSGLKYSLKKFGDAEFEFRSPSSIPYPIVNRIGFTMIKSN